MIKIAEETSEYTHIMDVVTLMLDTLKDGGRSLEIYGFEVRAFDIRPDDMTLYAYVDNKKVVDYHINLNRFERTLPKYNICKNVFDEELEQNFKFYVRMCCES